MQSLVAPSLSIENKSPNRVDVVEEPPCTAQPKAPRSAFMCFSDANEKDILRTAGNPNAKKKELIKLVAEAWRLLSDRERADWDEVAREDKLRYVGTNTCLEILST